MKYIFQDSLGECSVCKRKDVSIISSDQEPGLMLARHFSPGKLAFCSKSLTPRVK